MILFETIRYQNFFAAGNFFLEIKLNEHQTTMISGKNGSGKSTFLDALTFVLFGKPFRNVVKPSVINSVNGRDCVVEIEFSIGPKKYKVIRGLKPTIFEIYCDGVLLNQDSKSKDYQEYLEKFILKMNFKSFTQIVVLGSATFVPFMQLTAADRRAIIEDLLDIQIFSAMNVILKQRILAIKESLTRVKYEQEVLKVKVQSTEDIITEIQNNNKSKVEKYQKDIADTVQQLSSFNDVLKLDKDAISSLSLQISDQGKIRKKYTSLGEIHTKLLAKKRGLTKELDFYLQNSDCPTCQQNLESGFKDSKITDRKQKLDEIDAAIADINTENATTADRLNEIISIERKINDLGMKINLTNVHVSVKEKYIEKLEGELNTIGTGDGTSGLLTHKDILVDLQNKEKKLELETETCITDRHYYDIAANLLKDTGIKTKIIAQYLPVINKTVNKYLSEMDFFVNFNLNESFEETIKSRFRDEFAYESFSEGEKTRIDLSLMFTWREIAKMKNSINTNLIVFDEILDSSLDFGGTDILINILNSFGDTANIFIISHKSDTMADKFKNGIKFVKRGNFSFIEE